MNTIEYSVPSIHCQHCVHAIKMELSELEGVNEVSVNLDKKTVEVSFNSPTTEDSIKDMLIEINYPPEN